MTVLTTLDGQFVTQREAARRAGPFATADTRCASLRAVSISVMIGVNLVRVSAIDIRARCILRTARSGDCRNADLYYAASWRESLRLLTRCADDSYPAVYYRAMLCMALCPSVSVRLSLVGVLSKRLNESSWFLASELPSTGPTLR